MSQDRATFQQLAEARLIEARVPLANGYPSGAYYLAGYAIECALKAIVAASFRADAIPDLKRVRDVYVHDLAALMRLAQLEEELEKEKSTNPRFNDRWTTAREWSEKSRYEVWTDDDASAILEAIDGEEGLLQWLRSRW